MQNTINKWIANSDNFWIIALIFSFTIVASAMIGAFRGWKKALYFTTWNITSLIISLLLASATASWLTAMFSEPIEMILGVFAPYFIPIVAFVYMIIINLFSWLPYIFLVKPFLKRMDNKKKDEPIKVGNILVNRSLGMMIGVFGAFPVCVLATNVGAITTGNVTLASANDKMVSVITGSKYKGISVPIVKIKKLALMAFKAVQELQIILDFIMGIEVDDINTIIENQDLINELLNWTDGHQIIGELMTRIGVNVHTDSTIVLEGMNSFTRPPELPPFDMSEKAKNSFKNMIMTLIGDSSAEAEAIILDFIDKLTN